MIEHPHKILIIEDDEGDRLTIERKLKDAGYTNIAMTGTAEEGFYIATSTKPDLILCDIILPDANGFDVCRQLRERLGNSTKIIAMTGAVDALDGKKVIESEVIDCVLKDIGYGDLIRSVDYFLRPR